MWLHTQQRSHEAHTSHTFTLHQQRRSHHVAKDHVLASMQVNTSASTWIKFDVTHDVRRWLRSSRRHEVVQLSCSTCTAHAHDAAAAATANQLVASTGSSRPSLYLTYNAASHDHHSRVRRDITCRERTIGCCRKYLNVSFDEHDAYKFIIAPRWFSTGFCRGTCNPYSDPRTS